MPHNVAHVGEAFQDFLSTPEGVPSPELFDPINIESFEDQAGREVAPFFEENLANALKQLELAKTQQRESKELAERQTEEDFGAFIGIQDRSFARSLQRTQSGFAGRGTFTSGFRRGDVGELREGQEDVLEGAEREKRQTGEVRTQGFEQFLARSGLQEERTRLENQRAESQERAARQQQLFAGAVTGRQQAQGAFEDRFSSFLGEKGAG